MKIKIFISLFVFVCILQTNFAQPNFQWARKFGETGANEGYAMAVDQSGNVYTIGRFTNNCDFDPGPGTNTINPIGSNDMFISKLDVNGNYLWAWSIPGNGTWDKDIETDVNSNVYITGAFSGTVDFDPGAGINNQISSNGSLFVLKLNQSGGLVWVKTFGNGTNEASNSLDLDASGNVFVAGTFSGTADFDPGPGTSTLSGGGIFVTKLDVSGNFVWAKNMGNSTVAGVSIATDLTGNICVKSQYSGTGDFDPGPGMISFTATGLTDIFVGKINSTGNLVWAKSLGGNNGALNTYANTIDFDASGNVFVFASFFGTEDFDPGPGTYTLTAQATDAFLTKLDASGNFVWTQVYGSTSGDIANSMVMDVNGNIFLVGAYQYTVDFDAGPGTTNLASNGVWDAFIVKLDATANLVWARSLGGTGSDVGLGVKIDNVGNVYATGAFTSLFTDFDPGPGTYTLSGINGPSENACFVLKLGNGGGVGIVEESNSFKAIDLFPNPSTGLFNFTLPQNINLNNAELIIYDVYGRVISAPKISKEKVIAADLSNYNSGVYFYKLISDDKIISSGKLIKE